MTGADPETLDRALPADATTVLLAGPPTDQVRSLCTALHGVDSSTDVVVVTYTRDPADCLAQVDDGRDVVVITVGDTAPQTGVTTRHVNAPADLTQLGIELDNALEGRERVTVCFDSVTTTLQYAEYTDVYEFLHAITGRLRAADARLHAHVNPLAHDEQVLAGLTTLFDARVEHTADDLSVRTRPPVVAETDG